ncbi:MAG: DUF551 domain-containing protein [Balneolaceae bacterium]
MDNWIPVSKQLPEEDDEVFYYFKLVGVHAGYFTYDIMDPEIFDYDVEEEGLYISQIFYGPSGILSDDVTHWMPRKKGDSLPTPPNLHFDIHTKTQVTIGNEK